MGTAGNRVSGSLRRRALLTTRKISSCLDPEVWFSTMDAGVLVRGALSMQWLEPAKEFRSLIANAWKAWNALAVKRRFPLILPEENKDPKFRAVAWQSLLWAIWGRIPKMVVARSSRQHRRN